MFVTIIQQFPAELGYRFRIQRPFFELQRIYRGCEQKRGRYGIKTNLPPPILLTEKIKHGIAAAGNTDAVDRSRICFPRTRY